MSKGLVNIKSKTERANTVKRRLTSNTMGLGYWAAFDAAKLIGIDIKPEQKILKD